MLRQCFAGHLRRPGVALVRLVAFVSLACLALFAPRAKAAETACFQKEDATLADCPTTANTISVTPNTPFEVRVVYDPKGGKNISGLTVDFDYPGTIGSPTCTDTDAALPNFLGAIDKTATNIKASYFNIAGATSGKAKFMKCSFPGGADGTNATLTWKVDGAGGTAQAVDDTGGALGTIQFVNVNIKIETPPCTQITTNATLTATGKNVGGTATCELAWTAPAGAGTGQNCALTATPYAITQNGTAITGSPFATATTSTTVNTALVFGTTYNYSLVTSTTAGALAAVPATCTPQQGSAPEITFTPPTSALKGSPLKVEGTFNDTDSSAVTVTVFYKSGDAAPATATLNRSAQATNGNWSANVPGASVNEGDDIAFIIRAADDIGLTKFIPNTITDTDIPSATPSAAQLAAAFTKAGCAAANCLSGDDIAVGTALAFGDTTGDGNGDLPVPSEMPFNPADNNQPAANRPGLDVRFAMNAPSKVTARIYTLNGRLIRQLPSSNTDFLPNTCHYLQGCNWDGTDYGESTVDYVPNGLYIIHVAANCNFNNEPEGVCPDGFKTTSLNLTKGIVVMK